MARFAAVEDLFHQALDTYGIPIRTENRKYNYVASISEPESGFLSVDEYRADKLSLDRLSRSDCQHRICRTRPSLPSPHAGQLRHDL